MQPPTSALPDFYYAFFAVYEPALSIISSLITLYDPRTVHNAQAPWPAGTTPPAVLPKASIVTIMQFTHVCALVAVLNIALLTAARRHLASQPALQEKIVQSFLTPLLIGDFTHLSITLWALGDDWWNVAQWSLILRVTIFSAPTLIIPRVMWHLGIWRYVDTRDRVSTHVESSRTSSSSKKN